MENEYRWVLATAVQSLAIFNADKDVSSWVLFTAAECILIAGIIVALLLMGGPFFCIYSCVYPGGHHEHLHYYGRLAENPFLAKKNPALLMSTARGHGYGAPVYGAP